MYRYAAAEGGSLQLLPLAGCWEPLLPPSQPTPNSAPTAACVHPCSFLPSPLNSWLADLERLRDAAAASGRPKVTILDVADRAMEAGASAAACQPTSPRSVEACLRLGIDPATLVHRPLDFFVRQVRQRAPDRSGQRGCCMQHAAGRGSRRRAHTLMLRCRSPTAGARQCGAGTVGLWI